MHMQSLSKAGVLREFSTDQHKENTEQWIRAIHNFDDEHFLIVCCTYAQAKAFQHVTCIEMDLSFKMVRGKTNLFSIAGWDENSKRMHALCYAYAMRGLIFIIGIKVWVYAFLNLETRVAYAKMFELVFKVLGDAARSSIQFAHIHGTGLRTATVDMCKKQAGGMYTGRICYVYA